VLLFLTISGIFVIKINMENKMEIIITDKEGLRQVSSFSENKIKHITETNQWVDVIKEILKHINNNND
jgi:hypothetical protein